ncbi:MAG: hypothetical protein QOF51_3511 [Chloroflexota bacterium]|nr:hypothetical protein [Chloroflexota bacterium]
MDRSNTLSGRWRLVVELVGVFAVYVAAGKLGLAFAVVNPSASAVWAPTGIAIGALLTLGMRVWPAILLGAFVVNVSTAGSPIVCLDIAIGNTLEALLGAYLVQRLAGGRRAFASPNRVFRFALGAVLVAPMVSATIGVTSLALGGSAEWSNFGTIWFTWWLGDAAGALLVTPVLVLWNGPRLSMTRRQAIEAAGVTLAVVAGGLAVFVGLHPLDGKGYPIELLAMPLLVWTAVRFGPRATASANALLAAIAVLGTVQGSGPFGSFLPSESLPLLQTFIGVAALTSLVLAAAVRRQQRAEETTRATEEQLRLIEERRQAEAALRDAQAIAHLGSWSWDIEADVVAWSAEMYRVYGVEPGQFDATYESFLEHVHPNDRDGVSHTIGASFSSREPFDFVHRIVRPDGSERTLHARGAVVIGPDGAPVRMVGTGHDITELVQAAEERAALSREQTARAQAEAAVRERDTFLSVVAHELRTPLTGLRLASQMLERDVASAVEPSPLLVRRVERVNDAVEKLVQLVGRLLDVSRVEAGRLAIQPVPSEVTGFVADVVERYRPQAGSTPVELHTNGPVQATLDPMRVEQVLVNLLNNALRFSPAGEPVVIDVAQPSPEGVRIAVSDRGPGVAAEHRDRIFERFYQVDSSTRGTGLGLGLYISREIARLHSGQLWVESAALGGARFVLELPATRPPADLLDEELGPAS